MTDPKQFADLPTLAAHLRSELESKKYILLYAYNGTGKTRLSMAFKDIGKQGDARDTLYFNAFTEDLFTWDNDLEGDSDRKLKINRNSHFFDGLAGLEMDNRIRPLLQRYVDFDFRIDTDEWVVRFSPKGGGTGDLSIKVSRGEENIFIWCFFLAIVQIRLDDDNGTGPYNWVKYIYIDDPISSLDEHNAITVANHLTQLLKQPDNQLKTVISSHHTLFFNVLCNELGKAKKYFLSLQKSSGDYFLRDTGDTPFFQHIAILAELDEAARSDRLYTHHFNMLRTVLEKSASFHGYSHIAAFINQETDDQDGVLYKRILDILSHGNYSLYEPRDMQEENKAHFKKILKNFLNRYPFNPDLFPK